MAESTRTTHINELPVEILAEILCTWRRDVWDESQLSPERDDHAWVHTLYVCKHWRNIGAGFPRLWSYIKVDAVEPTKKYLQRSGGIPLHVKGSISQITDPRFASLILIFRQLGRIESMTLEYGRGLLQDKVLFWALYGEDLGMLRSVKFVHARAGYDEAFPRWTASSIPAEILPFPWDTAKGLAHLVLDGFHPRDIQPGIAPSLTSIRITNCCEPWNPATVHRFCLALRNAVALEVLEVSGTYHPVSAARQPLQADHRDMFREPSLRQLRALTISGPHPLCHHLLDNLNFPPTTRVSLCTESLEDREEQLRYSQVYIDRILQSYSHTISRMSSDVHAPVLRTISLRAVSVGPSRSISRVNEDCVLETWDDELSNTSFEFSKYTPRFRLRSPIWDADFLLRRLCNALALESVHAFHLSDIPNISQRCLVKALRNMKNIRWLSVLRTSAWELPEALLTRLKPDDGSSAGPMFLPRLETLVISDVKWRNFDGDHRCSLCYGDDGLCEPEADSFFVRMTKTLKGRRTRGAGIRCLHVMQSRNFGMQELKELETIVPEVVWDTRLQ